jgi:alpha(1,3/1,4) fucosyltransferase
MKATYVVEKYFQGNKIFDETLNKSKFDGRTFRHIKVKEFFKKNGVDLNTQDIYNIDKSDFVIYLDMPRKLPNKFNKSKSFLILVEPPSVKPINFEKKLHVYFNKVFTWDDNLVDNKFYFKINLSFDLNSDFSKEIGFLNRKFICMIARNKFSEHKDEANSVRRDVIRWSETNNKSLDLFGYGWNRFLFKLYPFTYLNRFNFILFRLSRKSKKYTRLFRGTLNSKFDVLGEYKFCFCFENITKLNGYITEKIFDCFFSKTIPIYLGAENINDFIPKETYIDFRDYKSLEDLYSYLESLSETEYLNYLYKTKEFLKSDDAKLFDANYNANLLVSQILNS